MFYYLILNGARSSIDAHPLTRKLVGSLAGPRWVSHVRDSRKKRSNYAPCDPAAATPYKAWDRLVYLKALAHMQLFTFVTSILACLTAFVLAQPGTPWVRIDKNDAALLIVDHQLGLFTIVRDQSPVEFWNNVLGHAELAKIFNLPTVITSSAEDGPNGKIPEEILTMLPNATVVRRQGEVNAWDSAEFKEAVKATGKKQLIVAGITTDVCVYSPLRESDVKRTHSDPHPHNTFVGLHCICRSVSQR